MKFITGRVLGGDVADTELLLLFRSKVKGSNFMTPDFEEFLAIGNYIVEISSGGAMDGNGKMYGVTVIDVHGKREHDLSQCCHSLEELDECLLALNRRCMASHITPEKKAAAVKAADAAMEGLGNLLDEQEDDQPTPDKSETGDSDDDDSEQGDYASMMR